MYDFDDVLDAFRYPYKLGRELNLLYHRRLRLHDYNHDGIDIFAEDWDNLILLDACRYDAFKSEWDGPGRLESRESRGSSSIEFVRGNFRDRELLDTVCVTANGWYLKIDDSYEIHDVVPVFEHTDDEREVVLPETMTEWAERIADEYPNKRLLIHYMQPHAPYLGETGRRELDGIRSREDISDRVRNGSFSAATLREAYRENLRLVIDAVEPLLEKLEGKTVISADHGEMLGERHFPIPMRDYVHPHGIDNDVLVEVPWLVYEDGSRRRIVAEEPESESRSVDEASIDDHLRQLGYRQ